MSNKIKYTDIAEKELFQNAIDSAEKLLLVLDKLEKQFKDLLRESQKLAKEKPLDSYEGIRDVEQAVNKTKTAVEGLDKVEKERARLQEKLKALEEGRLDANIKLRQEIAARTRTARQAAKESSEAATAYERESARLVRLRREYKDLAIQNKGNTKEAKALLKEITALDRKLKDLDESVGQNQRSVGNYRIAVDRLQGSFKILAGSAVVATLAKVAELFNANSEGSARLQKGIGRITVTLNVLVGRFVKAIPAIEALFGSLSINIEKVFLNIQKAFASLPELLGGSEAKAKELEQQLGALEAQEVSQASALDQLAAAFEGVSDEIDSLIDTNDRLVDNTLQYQKQINTLNQELEVLRTRQKQLQVQSNDSTTSLEQQTQATIDLIDVTEQVSESEIKVLEKRLELARLNAKVNKNNIEAQTELADAIVALEAAKGDAAATQVENAARLREIERDNIELDLDQLIDIADKRKAINEQIAADDRQSLDVRIDAIQQATSDIESSFRKQAQAIQEGTGIQFNIDDLINEQDTVKLNERIKSLGLDEIRQNRLREIIQERAQAVQDLAVAQEDLQRVQQNTAILNDEILLQEEALRELEEGNIPLQKVLLNLDEKRLQQEIDNLQLRLSLAERTSIEFLDINKELNEKLLEQDTKRIQKQQEQQQKAAEVTFDFIKNFSQKQSEARIEAIDEKLAASQQRIDQLRKLSEQGVQNTEENIAVEKQKQAELEQQRARAAKRQQQAQLALTAIETYNAKLQAGEPNPLAATALDIAALEVFVNSLTGFYSGTEKVEDSMRQTMSGKDGYIVRVDGSERILTGQQNAMIGDMSNMQLAMLASAHNNGQLNHVSADNSQVIAGLNKVAETIEKQPVYLGRDYDSTKKAIIDVVKKHNRIERVSRKNKLL